MYLSELDSVEDDLDSIGDNLGRLKNALDKTESDLDQHPDKKNSGNDLDNFGLDDYRDYGTDEILSGRADDLKSSLEDSLEKIPADDADNSSTDGLRNDLHSIESSGLTLREAWNEASSDADALISDLSDRLADFDDHYMSDVNGFSSPVHTEGVDLAWDPDQNTFSDDSSQIVNDLTNAKQDAEDAASSINGHDLDGAKTSLSNLEPF